MNIEPKSRNTGDYIWILIVIFFISASGLFLFLLYQTFSAPPKAPTITSTRNTSQAIAKSPLPDDLAVDRLVQNSARHQYTNDASLNDPNYKQD